MENDASACKIQNTGEFMSHWQEPLEGSLPDPLNHQVHPITNEHIAVENWLQAKDNPYIFISKHELGNGQKPDFYYCAIHNRWLKLGGSIGNINKHIVHEHIDAHARASTSTVLLNIATSPNAGNFNEEQKRIIRNSIKSFIACSGGSFAGIENKYIQKAFPFLGDAQKFRDETIKAASSVKAAIKSILKESCLISLAFDEWEDNSLNRYLGVTAKAFYNKEFIQFCLALEQLINGHADATTIVNAYQNVVHDYGIEDKILAYVSDNCNTMISVGNKIGGFRFPCICHLLELVLSSFVAPISLKLKHMSHLANQLNETTDFRNLIRGKTPCIAAYTPIRWTSLLNFIDTVEVNAETISNFQKDRNIDNGFSKEDFELLKQIKPFVETINREVKTYENDDFGNISLILGSFESVNEFLSIMQEEWKFNELIMNCVSHAMTKLEEITKKYSAIFHPLLDAAVYLNPCIVNNGIDIRAAKEYIAKLMSQISSKRQTTNETKQKQSVETSSKFAEHNKRYAHDSLKIPAIDNITTSLLNGTTEELINYWIEKYQQEESMELAIIALSILGMFVSSCSVEREFSACGRCKTKERMKLMKEALEAQALLMINEDVVSKFTLYQ